MAEMRTRTRQPAEYHAELIWKTQDGEKRLENCKAVDFSDLGIAVECPTEVPVCSDIIVRAESANLTALSQVRHCTWTSSVYRLGLEFLAKTSNDPRDPVEADHYEILRLSQSADEEAISRVYRTLARRFHPDNHETGDTQAFLRVNQAWRILSDPQKRARYDEERAQARLQRHMRLRSREFFAGIRGEQNRRNAILCMLYRKRSSDFQNPGMSMLEIERMTGFTREEIGFAIWYLREKKMLFAGENTQYSIAAEGVDYVESNHSNPQLLAIAAPGISPVLSSPGLGSPGLGSPGPKERHLPDDNRGFLISRARFSNR